MNHARPAETRLIVPMKREISLELITVPVIALRADATVQHPI